MQDIRIRFEQNTLGSPQNAIINTQPITSNVETLKQHFNLFQQNFSENIASTKSIDSLIKSSTSSEDDNSPTELNCCRRLVEKPPLVSRKMFDFSLNLLSKFLAFKTDYLNRMIANFLIFKGQKTDDGDIKAA